MGSRENRFYCFISLDWGLTSQLTMFQSCRDVYLGWASNRQSCSTTRPYVEMRTRELAWFGFIWSFKATVNSGEKKEKKRKKRTRNQTNNQTWAWWTNTFISYFLGGGDYVYIYFFCGYSLEPPQWGNYNVYAQSMTSNFIYCLKT